MSEPLEAFSRPERILLVLARSPQGCRGKAIRFKDGSEYRFDSVEKLAAWLMESDPESTNPSPESNG